MASYNMHCCHKNEKFQHTNRDIWVGIACELTILSSESFWAFTWIFES